LVVFGESRLRWHFQGGERPAWTAEHEAAERSLAEWGVANCELPAVIGPGAGAAPPSWTDLSDDEIADNCNWGREQIVEAAAEYVDLFGAPAEHPILLESHLELYFGSDFFTLGPGGDAIAAPGGACDI